MKTTTRMGLAAVALAAALPGCERADTPAPTQSPGTQAAPTWHADSVGTAAFRAFRWGAGDTLWGIVRGRPGWLAADGTSGRLDDIAWDVQAAAGRVTWTNEDGLRSRAGSGNRNLLPPDAAPGLDFTGPDVLWSPRGTRALLTWTGEGAVVNAVLEGDSVRRLTASQPGLGGADRALWLDEERVIIRVVAFAPRTGPAEYREAGYRADLAELDVTADRLRLITAAADGEFHSPAGVLRSDTIVASITTEGGVPAHHVLLDVRTGGRSTLPLPTGRAAAAHGIIALLRPIGGNGPESAWRLDMVTDGIVNGDVLEVRGHAVRLIWHPQRPVLAVAQESESAGMRTWIVSRE